MVKYLVLKADITKVCLEKFEYVIGCLYDFVNRIAQKKTGIYGRFDIYCI